MVKDYEGRKGEGGEEGKVREASQTCGRLPAKQKPLLVPGNLQNEQPRTPGPPFILSLKQLNAFLQLLALLPPDAGAPTPQSGTLPEPTRSSS